MQDLTLSFDATQRGWVPGRERFRREIEAVLGRAAGRPIRGRPVTAKESPAERESEPLAGGAQRSK